MESHMYLAIFDKTSILNIQYRLNKILVSYGNNKSQLYIQKPV